MYSSFPSNTIWCVLCEERSQYRALRRVSNWGIVEQVDEGRNTEHVQEEDKLLAEMGTGLACMSEKADRVYPFVCGDAVSHNHESMG